MFAGVAVMILMIPFNAVIASISEKLQVIHSSYINFRMRSVCGMFDCTHTSKMGYVSQCELTKYLSFRLNRWHRKIIVFMW